MTSHTALDSFGKVVALIIEKDQGGLIHIVLFHRIKLSPLA